MNKIIFGMLLLAGMVLAEGIPDPVMEQKYQETSCWADFADELIGYSQEYYAPDPPPSYLQDLREDLWSEGGEMYQLFMCGIDDDRACFNAQLKNVMNLVRQMQGAFWKESIRAIIGGSADVGDIATYYRGGVEDLNTCLEGGMVIDPPPGPGPI